MDLAMIGLYEPALRFGERDEIVRQAADIENLGYGAVWIPDIGGDVIGALDLLFSSTSRVTVGTGVVNLWMHEPSVLASGRESLVARHGREPVLGLGVSHKPLVDSLSPGRFEKPLQSTIAYLDALDTATPPLPSQHRILAALRPQMLELARDRCAGAFPYHMPPEHTQRARAALGPGKLLVVEQPVAVGPDIDTARALARDQLALYLPLPNYLNAWRWLGFPEQDLANGGSDRFVDAIFVTGDEDAVSRRVQEHREAGADHVCIQVLAVDSAARTAAWRHLAPVLL